MGFNSTIPPGGHPLGRLRDEVRMCDFVASSVYLSQQNLMLKEKFEIFMHGIKLQGLVVQSIVCLTGSLRGQLIKCFTTL